MYMILRGWVRNKCRALRRAVLYTSAVIYTGGMFYVGFEAMSFLRASVILW